MDLYLYRREHAALAFLDRWYSWAIRSRLKPMVEVAMMLKKRAKNILTYIKLQITNAKSEAIRGERPTPPGGPTGDAPEGLRAGCAAGRRAVRPLPSAPLPRASAPAESIFWIRSTFASISVPGISSRVILRFGSTRFPIRSTVFMKRLASRAEWGWWRPSLPLHTRDRFVNFQFNSDTPPGSPSMSLGPAIDVRPLAFAASRPPQSRARKPRVPAKCFGPNR